MRGFWDTWLHIVVGLFFVSFVGGLVYAIHDIGRIHGRGEVRHSWYEQGYKAGEDRGYFYGYKDGLLRETYGRSK